MCVRLYVCVCAFQSSILMDKIIKFTKAWKNTKAYKIQRFQAIKTLEKEALRDKNKDEIKHTTAC